MCTVKEIQEAIREDCKSQHDMDTTDIDRVMQTLPFAQEENAAAYCRQVYDAGYSPICPVLFLPTFLKDEIPQEHKDGLDMARDYLRRSHVLVVCGHGIDETVKNDIATAERLRITATTLDGILAVKGQGRGKGGARHWLLS